MDTLEKTNHPIRIEFNKGKILFLIVASIVLCIAGLVMFNYALKQNHLHLGFLKALSLATIVFFTGSAIYTIKKFFDPKAAILFTEKGIEINTSAIAGQFITWEEITGFNIGRVQRSKFLLIHVKNPDRFLSKVNILNKLLIKMNISMYGTPISLAAASINSTLEELVEIVIAEQQKYAPHLTAETQKS